MQAQQTAKILLLSAIKSWTCRKVQRVGFPCRHHHCYFHYDRYCHHHHHPSYQCRERTHFGPYLSQNGQLLHLQHDTYPKNGCLLLNNHSTAK